MLNENNVLVLYLLNTKTGPSVKLLTEISRFPPSRAEKDRHLLLARFQLGRGAAPGRQSRAGRRGKARGRR